jgi:hypothetical protein
MDHSFLVNKWQNKAIYKTEYLLQAPGTADVPTMPQFADPVSYSVVIAGDRGP